MKIKDLLMTNKMQKLALVVMVNIFYLFFGSYLVGSKIISYEGFAIGLYSLLIINIIVGITIVKMGYYKKNLVHIFMILIIIFGIISTIFAINPIVALFGSILRYEGLISIMYYFSLMFITSFVSKKYRKVIILFILITGVIECFYGILQIYEVPNIHVNYDVLGYEVDEGTELVKWNMEAWATGFSCNPNYFATHMLLCLTLTVGLFLEKINKKNNIIYGVLVALFFYGVLISNTLSCAVGLLGVLFFASIYAVKNKILKKFFVIIFIFLCITGITVLSNKTKLLEDFKTTGIQTAEMAKGNLKDKFGTNRIYIWKNGVKLIPNNLITGIGIDNFLLAFDGNALTNPSGNVTYDKLHNEYLQILITEGIFCLISYLVMYGIIILKSIKNSFKNKELYLILPVIGYLIQAFFNISVIEVAPIFFIILGLNLSNE